MTIDHDLPTADPQNTPQTPTLDDGYVPTTITLVDGPGRPSKRTPEAEERILAALRNGNTKKTAAALAYISVDVFDRWQADSAYFAAAVATAIAEAQESHVAALREASAGGFVTRRRVKRTIAQDGSVKEEIEEDRSAPDWRGPAFLLERSAPDDWGRRDRLTIDRERALDQVRRQATAEGVDPELAARLLLEMLSGAAAQPLRNPKTIRRAQQQVARERAGLGAPSVAPEAEGDNREAAPTAGAEETGDRQP